MVLIAVDDLLFSSRIRTAASQLGTEILFTRTSEDVLREARSRKPVLIVFDLNADKIQPVETIRAIKADPALCAIRALGFVSHVRTDLIEAARAAGAEVMPRSAFASGLDEILRIASPA